MKINIKILQTIGVILVSSSLIAGGFIWFARTTRAQELLPAYQYEIAEQSVDPILEPSQPGFLMVKLRNIGAEAWPTQELYLSSIYFDGTDGRSSSFATSAWIDRARILIDSSINDKESIRPRGVVTFNIPIQAVIRKALYQEYFKLHLGSTIMTGPVIKWIVQVGNELSYQDTMGKQIKIWLSDQRLWAIENNVVILDTPISSGKAGYATPKGKYKILVHIDTAYSSKYHLFMDNWMALYNEWGFLGYGLHALPHWKVKQGNRVEGEIKDGRLYTNGKLYEDYMHLGKVMSHGCVRVGIDPAKVLYNWAPNGTPVIISA